jgi:hypothetical protein
MTTLTPNQTQTLTAFVVALGQQTEPLPAGLQAQLPAIGQNLANRIVELPAIASSLPNLDKAFRTALADLQAKAAESSNAAQPPATSSAVDQKLGSEIYENAVAILTDPNSVGAAQTQIAQVTKQGQNFWERLFGSRTA